MVNCCLTRMQHILVQCPACQGQFHAPLGTSEGACVFCGVQLRVQAGVRVMSARTESGMGFSRKWKQLRHNAPCGSETRPMFLVQKEEEEPAVAIF